MCGIVGFLNKNYSHSDNLASVLRTMSASIAHRGPDSFGEWFSPEHGLALGHQRLAILDLSPEGHQPMHSHSNRYVIVFNGEIYNFQELRDELHAKGYTFKGHSDTEVMLAAVDEWGLEKAVRKFVGMFAFALWDQAQMTLSLVRDRVGEKPLYYGVENGTFIFASELKPFLKNPSFTGEINRNSLPLYLRYNYIPAPYTIYQNVKKLMPGTILTLKLHSDWTHIPDPVPYWSAMEAALNGVSSRFTLSEEEIIEELDTMLKGIISKQMIADVPLGAFLSGGIDSTTVVSLMQAISSKPVKTFTIGFHEQGYNEAVHAKMVAKHLQTDHTEVYVTPKESMDVIPMLPRLYDEPFADSSQIPTYLVSKLAREHVTVSLSGDAGDELFGGYNRYAWGENIWNRIGKFPRPVRRLGSSVLTSLSAQTWDTIYKCFMPVLPSKYQVRLPGDKLHKLAHVIGVRSPEELYYNLVSSWKDPTSVVLQSLEPSNVLKDANSRLTMESFSEKMMYLDMVSYLPDDILVKVDRASMGVSLESRVPFLDHRLIEYAWKIPLHMKIRNGQGKWILRQVLYKYVPRELVERPKMGFGVPIDLWLRGPLKEWAEELLSKGRLKSQGYFNENEIHMKWEEHKTGKRNWQHYLWSILMFQAWLEK
ncbi:asparagine synthase (glutamine-hydrolyzing) [Gorillibacterium sp. sgz5001074]|uniref:asparagine synthase (glutamine-hydrolyzing) n=1 Tax=Gorillibacterium sp. sgz5001074 TaxID=3446695 RepID=UPI003F66FB3A